MSTIPNMGSFDRIIRAGVGVLLLLLALTGLLTGGLAWVAGIVGVVALGTSTLRFCPAYALIGVKTCGK